MYADSGIRVMSDSPNPTTYMAHATAFAIENIRPMDPPNSGPNDLDII